MQLLKQSTASTVYVGPVLDSTGAAVTTAVLGDFRLIKNGTAATLTGATVTHDANGYYTVALTTGNTDTTGRLTLAVGNTAMSMSTHRYSVLLASVFDALITNATNATGGLPTATAAITTFAGAISTFAGGAVASVTGAVGSVTNRVTANVDQWNGATVTGMPMPTYTQPTGFLTATFPGTVASTTNITAATGIVLAGVTHTGAVIPTVTDVTSKTGYTATVSDKTGFSLAPTTGLGNQTATITGNLTGSVGSVTGNVGGSVGSISGVTFPSNFASFAITVGGGVTVATNADKSGYVLLAGTGLGNQTANITGNLTGSVGSVASYGTLVSDIATAVWSATSRTLSGFGTLASDVATAVWAAGTRTLTAFGFNVNLTPTTGMGNQSGTVGGLNGVTFPTHFDNLSIDPNGHVTSNVDSISNNAITASSIQANAFTAAKFATDSIGASALATDAATKIANAVAAPSAATIADAVWDEILVGHLGTGTTGAALNNSGGSGNPWITDIATGYSGTQAGNVLNQVKAKTDLITSGTTIQTSIPVTAQGQIAGPLIIGDDYLTANGRQFDWTIALPSGFVASTSTCKFGMVYEDETGVSSFNLSGSVTDIGSGNVRLRFELPRATTGTLKAGFHRWSVEIVSAAGVEVTAVAYSDRRLVEWREKQT